MLWLSQLLYVPLWFQWRYDVIFQIFHILWPNLRWLPIGLLSMGLNEDVVSFLRNMVTKYLKEVHASVRRLIFNKTCGGPLTISPEISITAKMGSMGVKLWKRGCATDAEKVVYWHVHNVYRQMGVHAPGLLFNRICKRLHSLLGAASAGTCSRLVWGHSLPLLISLNMMTVTCTIMHWNLVGYEILK